MCLQSRFCFVVCALGLGRYRNLYKKFFGSVGVTQHSTCFSSLSTGLASIRKLTVKVKVEQSRYRPGVAQRAPGI
jgi:hypothetical protein